MEKPIVFLAHSSLDDAAIKRLREGLRARTGGALEIFASSDGQSIPFGKNWVHRVEEALATCKLMFVFLSPSSLDSHWIYFESGFAYSRDIRVVPVAIFGVDLGSQPPPLSLLQGFNLRSADGLNNLIAIINDKFSMSFKEEFDDDAYTSIFEGPERPRTGPLGEYAAALEQISIVVGTKESVVERIGAAVTGHDLPFAIGKAGAETPGATYFQHDKSELRITLEPNLFGVTAPIAQDVLVRSLPEPDQKVSALFHFRPEVGYAYERHALTGRLFGTGVEFAEGRKLRFRGLDFEIYPSSRQDTWVTEPNHRIPVLKAYPSATELTTAPFGDLLRLLFERGAFWYAPRPWSAG